MHQILEHSSKIGMSNSRSIVIIMTMNCSGMWQKYTSNCLLHCGISNSQGIVYNFDEKGLHIDDLWRESISISLNAPTIIDDEWDKELMNHHLEEQVVSTGWQCTKCTVHNSQNSLSCYVCNNTRKLKQKTQSLYYHSVNNNCYDYVIRFLNRIKFENQTKHQKK